MDKIIQRKNYIDTLPITITHMITLPADASRRTFHRCFDNLGNSYILMDAPPPDEDVNAYLHIAKILHDYNLSAPNIIYHDTVNGYVLMQDFGDSTFTKILAQQPQLEMELYQNATDVLVHLYSMNVTKAVPAFDMALYNRELSLYLDWAISIDKDTADIWSNTWQQVLIKYVLSQPHSTLVLRDYHVDNLMWLPQNNGINRCGLLDFQDAVIGHASYDLMSLLWDARRDVSPEVSSHCLRQYINSTGINGDDFLPAYHLLAIQRTIKIIGIFHRLHKRDGKDRYLLHLPRLYNYLQLLLPQCPEIRDLFAKYPVLWGNND